MQLSYFHLRLLLFLTLFIALFLRLTGLNWDQGQHLHPDERYLTMVANDINWPVALDAGGKLPNFYQSAKLYLSPKSPLSPYNYSSFKSFLYGTFPIFWTKMWASALNWDDYGYLVLVGRFWSAIFSAVSVGLVYLLAKRIFKRNASSIGLLAAFFTATTVTLIQQAHFFTAESFLAAFSLLVIYYSYGIWERGKLMDFLLAGVSLGFALACKVSAIFLLGVIGLAVFLRLAKILNVKPLNVLPKIKKAAIGTVLVFLVSYLVYRLVQPYAFANANFLDFKLQPDFLQALKQQSAAVKGAFLYPPAFQWLLSTRFFSPLQNLILWALGPALGISGILGVFYLLYGAVLKRKWGYWLILSYIFFLFFYVAGQFVHSIRYLITIVPLVNIAAAYFWVGVTQKPLEKITATVLKMFDRDWPTLREIPKQRISKWRMSKIKGLKLISESAILVLWGVTLVSTLMWAVAFASIYTRETTRVAASKWIYRHIPKNAVIANEHWDDPLPLLLPGRAQGTTYHAQDYKGVMLQVYNRDDPQKLVDLYRGLSKAEYLILSSARASGSIGKLPDRFPIMSRYYSYLDSGSLGYNQVAKFTSYPTLFGIIVNDSLAEETFWVYDHPKVRIYQKVRDLSWEEFQGLFKL